jgi:hypothetical protein
MGTVEHVKGQIVASGAGLGLMQRPDDPYHDFVLGLTGKERPRVLFLPTAAGDDASYVVSFYETYHSDRCTPFHLRLFNRTVRDLRKLILSCDVITVGGGNPANMLDVWRRQGVDESARTTTPRTADARSTGRRCSTAGSTAATAWTTSSRSTSPARNWSVR